MFPNSGSSAAGDLSFQGVRMYSLIGAWAQTITTHHPEARKGNKNVIQVMIVKFV
jgi:hypothetical protein